jgi:hypothetical protein
MGLLNTVERTQANLGSYVGIDEACAHVFPLLIDQLEIANQQLGDGVETLIEGFNYLAQTMSEVNPEKLAGQIPDEALNRISKLQRFTKDLIQIGEQIHNTTVSEATERSNDANRKNLHRIVLRTLNMQQVAADVHAQADQLAKEIDATQNELIEQYTPESQSLTMDLVRVFMHMQVEINKMVVAFQFQDRVSQIISSVINSMKDLADYIREAGEHAKQEGTDIFVNLAEIIEHVERYYVSKEQYDLRGDHKDNTSDDIELF